MSRRTRRHRRALGAVCAATAFALLPAAARADAIRDQQWGLQALHTDQAWRTTKGGGITVAVVDTGVDGSLPDLAGQVLPGKDMIGFGATAAIGPGPGTAPRWLGSSQVTVMVQDAATE